MSRRRRGCRSARDASSACTPCTTRTRDDGGDTWTWPACGCGSSTRSVVVAQRADKTTVSDTMRIGWATVGSIIERVVARLRPSDALDGLRVIGVDELSYRRHHEYVTVVVDHERGAVVWAHQGKDADTLHAFFEELGPERCARLEAVTLDLSADRK